MDEERVKSLRETGEKGGPAGASAAPEVAYEVRDGAEVELDGPEAGGISSQVEPDFQKPEEISGSVEPAETQGAPTVAAVEPIDPAAGQASPSVEPPAAAQTPPARGLARLKCLNSLQLKIIGFILMTCDHAWATIAVQYTWLTAIGRLTFPIFAFLTVEGFFHTKNFKKYLLRMLIFALIAELPFNMMSGGGLLYPFHQNVLFTFCLALLFLFLEEKARAKGPVIFVLASVGIVLVSFLAGTLTFVDYNGYGQWMVLLFYFCHFIPKRFAWLVEAAGLVYINWFMMGGLVWEVTLFGKACMIPEQGLAVFALLFIWMYNGKPGPKSKAIQYACYAYYPAHILVLVILNHLLF